jgi:hypothetical protein
MLMAVVISLAVLTIMAAHATTPRFHQLATTATPGATAPLTVSISPLAPAAVGSPQHKTILAFTFSGSMDEFEQDGLDFTLSLTARGLTFVNHTCLITTTYGEPTVDKYDFRSFNRTIDTSKNAPSDLGTISFPPFLPVTKPTYLVSFQCSVNDFVDSAFSLTKMVMKSVKSGKEFTREQYSTNFARPLAKSLTYTVPRHDPSTDSAPGALSFKLDGVLMEERASLSIAAKYTTFGSAAYRRPAIELPTSNPTCLLNGKEVRADITVCFFIVFLM